MATYFSIVSGALLKLLAVAVGALYAGMVLKKYRHGRRYRLNLELRDPARSAEHFVVWLGVRVLDGCIRSATVIFNMLLEASIEVAQWFIQRSPAVQERIRSRFLV